MDKISLRINSFFAILTMLGCGVVPSYAQHYVGLAVGLGDHTQSGTFYSWESGATFDHASGQGFLCGLFYESAISNSFSWGAKADLDFKNMAANFEETRKFIFESPDQKFDSVTGSVLESTTIKINYLRISPYLQYTIFGGLYVQAGPSLSILLYENELWQLTLADPNQSFPDGSHSFGKSGMLSGVQSLRLSALSSAGYEFNVSSFEFGPVVSFEKPFTNLSEYMNWNVSSGYVALFVKYQL